MSNYTPEWMLRKQMTKDHDTDMIKKGNVNLDVAKNVLKDRHIFEGGTKHGKSGNR